MSTEYKKSIMAVYGHSYSKPLLNCLRVLNFEVSINLFIKLFGL